MNRTVSPLLIAIALGLGGFAQCQDSERPIRAEESRQKSVTAQTAGTAREVQRLIQEYQFNGIGSI